MFQNRFDFALEPECSSHTVSMLPHFYYPNPDDYPTPKDGEPMPSSTPSGHQESLGYLT